MCACCSGPLPSGSDNLNDTEGWQPGLPWSNFFPALRYFNASHNALSGRHDLFSVFVPSLIELPNRWRGGKVVSKAMLPADLLERHACFTRMRGQAVAITMHACMSWPWVDAGQVSCVVDKAEASL